MLKSTRDAYKATLRGVTEEGAIDYAGTKREVLLLQLPTK